MKANDLVAIIVGLILVGVAYNLVQQKGDANVLGWFVGFAGLAFIGKGLGKDWFW